ncbi:ISNCY family transposase, partial [Sinorhizobium meliloti]|nr:ISNCY family transposase [Sinorhizobium meliloti]
YFEALELYLKNHGAPVAFYSDKHSVFRVAKKDAKGGQGMTQFGRALSELNIEVLCANSSQAKGRVERMNRTLQDRLILKTNSEKIGHKPSGRKPGKRTDLTNDPAVIARRRQALSRQSAVEQGQPYPAQFNGE